MARPARYVGGEFNVRRKNGATPRIVLSYPDVYEIGISNPGLQILYSRLHERTPAAVERAYCPWPDLAALMRQRRVPLWTLESFVPVRECDLWGFTLQHELTYTNVLEMLDLAGVRLHAVERSEGDPIVMGGGPGTANPLSVSPFFDAFFVGEAEGRLGELVEAVGGVWVPARTGRGAVAAGSDARTERGSGGLDDARVERQVFTEFPRTPPVTEPLVPLLEAVHDRAVIEVMRGCSAGCRFCQAGMWYRPVRERPVDLVVESAVAALAATGCDEVSLISLSSCDYSGIEDAVRGIRERQPDVRISLPSLRIDSAAVGLARLGGDQRGSVTLAPEAATQELRDAINKRVDDGQFLEAVRAAYGSGFTGVKLYFMIGLPGESDDDVRAIASMAATALGEGRRLIGGRAHLSVSVSSFVPKPQTPLQREPFAGATAIVARQELLRAAMPRGVRLSFHDVGASQVEAALARGGEERASLIEGAWRLGARFDGWREHFDLDVWRRAAGEAGVDLDDRGGSGERAALPWDVVDARIAPRFLDEERDAVVLGRVRDDCRFGVCSDCGACVGEIGMDLAG